MSKIQCVKHYTVSTLAFNIHLFNFPCWHAAVVSSFDLHSPLFLINSLGKFFSEKCLALLCIYYHFRHKRGKFKYYDWLIFHPIKMHCFVCKMIISIGFWWTFKTFSILFLKGVRNLKFCIFRRLITFLLFIQFWCIFFLWINGIESYRPIVLSLMDTEMKSTESGQHVPNSKTWSFLLFAQFKCIFWGVKYSHLSGLHLNH
jgi:hypothetical protein